MLIRIIVGAMVLLLLTDSVGATEEARLALGDSLWDKSSMAWEIAPDARPMISLAEFRANTLRDEEVFLSAWPGPNHCSIYAVTNQQSLMLSLQGEEELKPLLLHLYQLASTPDSDQEELLSATEQVSDLLLGGLSLDWNMYGHITFAPSGIFNLVPMSLLMAHSPHMTVARIPSVSSLVNVRKSAATREAIKSLKVLAVGGVVDATKADSALAFKELDDLDNTYSGVTVVRPNAGGEAPELDKLLGFDVVHVGAHCVSNDSNPLESAIALDPSNPDMMIKASALKDARLDTRLVVLSRCSSTHEVSFSGEGLQSLASSFLEAGVPSLVAALWELEDGPTGFFMNSFYESLAQGENAEHALALARKKCRQDTNFNKPQFWGAFVLVGDGQVKVPLQAKTKFGGMGRPVAIFAGVGAGLFFILRMRR